MARAKKVAYRLDAAALVRRAAKAESERCVSLRPAPDTMSYLTGLLPVAQGVAVLAALRKAADGARAQGDARGRGQVMADTLVERVTGQRTADAVLVAHLVRTTTPTGHHYDSVAPALPDHRGPPAGTRHPAEDSAFERHLARYLAA